jgi:hypothetical protein
MLVLNYQLVFASLLIMTILSWTPIDKYFNHIGLIMFSLYGMITGFVLGIMPYDLTFISGGASVAAAEGSIGYLWTGLGLIELLRFVSLIFALFSDTRPYSKEMHDYY